MSECEKPKRRKKGEGSMQSSRKLLRTSGQAYTTRTNKPVEAKKPPPENGNLSEAETNGVLVDRSGYVRSQENRKLLAELKQAFERNRGKSLKSVFNTPLALLSHWCRLNGLIIDNHNFLFKRYLSTEVWHCLITMKSSTTGKRFTIEATGMKKFEAGKFAVMKVINYLLAEETNLDVPKIESKIPKQIRNAPSNTENYNSQPNSEADSVFMLEKSSHIFQYWGNLSEAETNGVLIDRSEYDRSQESQMLLAELKQAFERNLGKTYKSVFNTPLALLFHWCRLNGLIIVSHNFFFKQYSLSQVWHCLITLKSSTIGNLFTIEATAMNKFEAEKCAMMKVINYLLVEESNLAVTGKDANVIKKNQNTLCDTTDHTIALICNHLRSFEQSFIKSKVNSVSLVEKSDLNEESGHEQNYTCKTLEFDASTDISEESRSEDIPNEDRDSDIELLDEKASFLRADKNVVSLESTKKNPLQISGKSIEEFKQFIINNKGKYDYGTFKSAKALLCHWCPLNDLVETYDYQSINTVNTPVWLCTLTLKSADVGHFFTTDAYGKSKKRAGRLAAKKAVSYLFAETLVTSDEIKAMNLSVTKGDTKLLSFVSDTRNHNIKHVSPNVDPMPEKSVSAFPQKVSDNMDDKLELQEWCSKNGLKMQFETQQLEKTQYTCKVKVESYLYVGTGKGSKSDSERMACQDFIDHLKKVDNCQISSHEDPKSALNSWCSKQQLELSIKKEIFGEKIVVCYAKVESFDFVGRGIATKRKLAERMACQNFINHLEAKQNEVHSSVGSDDSQNINLSSEISRKKFDELHQDNEINFSNRIVPFGTAQIRLQQFFEENNINTDYTYTTDSVSLEGYHVASMKFYIRRSGRSFSASANAITVEAAKEECAFSLVKQLYSANLIHAKTKTQRKSIRPATSPIKLNVSDDLIEIITQLCTDFKVDAPELIPNKKGTNPILLSSLPSKYEDTNSSFKDDVLQLKTGIARMNWNAWSSRQIKKDQRHHNVSLKDMSKTIKTSQSKNSNSSTFRKRLKDRQNLPIFQSRNRILKLVDDHSVTIIKGSTGSGKSTQVCQYILDDAINNNMGSQCNIVVIEPRRICVTSLADRVAYERNERIGKSVGYCVRFDSSYPRAYGAILFCTPGSFLRRAESGLIGISHIIVDEIHERNIDTDYILLILHRLLKTPTPLKVILMSADVDIELFSSYFDNCGHITVKGKSHPVKDYFLEDCIKLINFKFKYPICQSYVEEQETEDVPPSTSNKKSEENLNSQSGVQDSSSYTPETLRAMALIDEQTVCPDLIEAIISWIREQRILGSILVFLPGWASIMQVTKHLEESKFRNSYSILPLHSKVKDLEKRQVFLPAPHGKTKVILSTSIAESSITIDDVVCVIDSCKTRISISQNNLSFKYVTEWASKVNLNQRLGRAGRLRPGYCFRLCTKARYEELPADIEPEMYRLPLYNIVLSIKTLKLRSIREVLYSALQPPPLRSIEEAERLLVELKCLDSHLELTPLGKIVARLPLDPRLSKMLLMSTLFDCPYQMLKLAAFTSVQEEFLECPPEATENVAKERYSDHLAVLYTLSTGEQLSYYQKFYENTPFKSYDEIIRIEEQLHSILERVGFDLTSSYGSVNKNTDIVTALLCQAFYPNICAFKQKRKVYLPGGKIGLVSKNSLIGSNNNDFKPPSRIFVFGEMTEAQVNICRNLTMISPMHLLCFTNCKVVFEKGLVKIDDWLPLKMDPNAAASIMCVRTMIEKVLHDIALDPSSRGATEHQRLSIAVQQLCKTDFDHRVVNAPQPSSSNHPENNNN